ncbi:hypothetical protein NUW54_g8534 [Trametes sanguinea]|uniref:Uncharacterized protein n=1 Tax=Trametes sanguinea TaxID=158606 RepID=A0ACC1PEA3_9APHY|nr:hypothetical protein NUW54_g8534 [Trametes sanguinea]
MATNLGICTPPDSENRGKIKPPHSPLSKQPSLQLQGGFEGRTSEFCQEPPVHSADTRAPSLPSLYGKGRVRSWNCPATVEAGDGKGRVRSWNCPATVEAGDEPNYYHGKVLRTQNLLQQRAHRSARTDLQPLNGTVVGGASSLCRAQPALEAFGQDGMHFRADILCIAIATALVGQICAQQQIILTNDDGWAVAQIRAQRDSLVASSFKVVLSAPAENESGTGSSSAPPQPLQQPCEFNTCPTGSPAEGFNASDPALNYVNSFPVDAVRFGIQVLSPQTWKSPPDFVVSGPNVGTNLGTVTLNSGTV